MSYRDDLDAARARAEAAERELTEAKEEAERELAAARDDGAEKEERVAQLERKLAAALGDLADVRDQLRGEEGRPGKAAPRHVRQRPASPRTKVLLAAVLGVVCVAAAGLWLTTRRAPPNPTCSIESEPPGAELYRVVAKEGIVPGAGHITIDLHEGTTPSRRPRIDWITSGAVAGGVSHLELRLEGYQTVEVAEPLVDLGCADRHVVLQKAAAASSAPAADDGDTAGARAACDAYLAAAPRCLEQTVAELSEVAGKAVRESWKQNIEQIRRMLDDPSQATLAMQLCQSYHAALAPTCK